MKAKLIFNGKEFEVELTETEARKFTEQTKRTGYERREDDGNFSAVDVAGRVDSSYLDVDGSETFADACYESANYYTSYEVAENNARADGLMRQMRRFAVEHREKDVNWRTNYDLFEIWYVYDTDEIKIEEVWSERSFGSIVFDSEETAQLAIDTFRDELIWYFTEYKDSL